MTIATFIKRVFLFLSFSLVLWITACDEQGDPLKTILVQNITKPIEVSQDIKEEMIDKSDGRASVEFCPEGDKFYIDTEGLYLITVFVPDTSAQLAHELYDFIINNVKPSDDVLNSNYGVAISVAKIHNGKAERHILTFSSKIDDFGRYWDGLSSDGKGGDTSDHFIFTLLVTPDARFVLRSDMFYNGLTTQFGGGFDPFDMSELQCTITYDGNTKGRITMFETSTKQRPQDLLADDFVDRIFDMF
jgi:hypothetical protein